MDTPTQALNSLNSKISGAAGILNTVAAAAMTVEQIAAQAVSVTGQALSGSQKLTAAITLANAIDPALAAVTVPIDGIFTAVVGVLNMFGIFKHKG